MTELTDLSLSNRNRVDRKTPRIFTTIQAHDDQERAAGKTRKPTKETLKASNNTPLLAASSPPTLRQAHLCLRQVQAGQVPAAGAVLLVVLRVCPANQTRVRQSHLATWTQVGRENP